MFRTRFRPGSAKTTPWRGLRDTSGATAIEYGLLAGLIAVAIIAALGAMSGAINTKFNTLSQTITSGR